MSLGFLSTPVPVALMHADGYRDVFLHETAAGMLEAIDGIPRSGARVLVKPNLLSAGNDGLVCTHPLVVRAVCLVLLEAGCKVTVGDSPGFGTASRVSRKIGLEKALADLGLSVITLGRPTPMHTSFGARIGVSRDALEQDCILNLPRLKAHKQMRISGALKNLFGVVVGVRKPLIHHLYGDKGERFESVFVEIADHLPPVTSLMDAVVSMHGTGPINGEPCPTSLLAASLSPVALDTAMYAMLGLTPARVPLWNEARRRRLPGSETADIAYPLAQPEDFDLSGFRAPAELSPQTFNPLRLAHGACRRVLARIM
ncbi:DUF362 domain-containing protein [Oceanidesulfovibrio marinus]|uniref:DUF362 domain-containing protein n=1 Tax=Oceanidesulfovibrio marinus TaxID=370038 RepID=A0ABX6NHE7_9BACT|nr:DUF362 domain-containing protein [Oceanidesulfovibrio marinus]QJT10064.1 DUF362 domain-containing protein [Oceanidesulfovibrio marinus]